MLKRQFGLEDADFEKPLELFRVTLKADTPASLESVASKALSLDSLFSKETQRSSEKNLCKNDFFIQKSQFLEVSAESGLIRLDTEDAIV